MTSDQHKKLLHAQEMRRLADLSNMRFSIEKLVDSYNSMVQLHELSSGEEDVPRLILIDSGDYNPGDKSDIP